MGQVCQIPLSLVYHGATIGGLGPMTMWRRNQEQGAEDTSVTRLLYTMDATQERLACTPAGVYTRWTDLFHLDIS